MGIKYHDHIHLSISSEYRLSGGSGRHRRSAPGPFSSELGVRYKITRPCNCLTFTGCDLAHIVVFLVVQSLYDLCSASVTSPHSSHEHDSRCCRAGYLFFRHGYGRTPCYALYAQTSSSVTSDCAGSEDEYRIDMEYKRPRAPTRRGRRQCSNGRRADMSTDCNH